MTRQEAMTLLGVSTTQAAADILGMTRQGFERWGDTLPEKYADRVTGAALRLKTLNPCQHTAAGK